MQTYPSREAYLIHEKTSFSQLNQKNKWQHILMSVVIKNKNFSQLTMKAKGKYSVTGSVKLSVNI